MLTADWMENRRKAREREGEIERREEKRGSKRERACHL